MIGKPVSLCKLHNTCCVPVQKHMPFTSDRVHINAVRDGKLGEPQWLDLGLATNATT